MTIRGACAASVAALLVACLALPMAAKAQAKDDLWEVTTKMEMAGMAMPGQTNRFCAAKGGKDEDYIPKRGDCRVLESKRTGNKVAFKMVCKTPDAMNVAGEFVYATNSYEGRMQMSGNVQGQQMEMTQTFSGKRVGDCTAK